MMLADVDWGRKCVRLIGKGTREEAWVAASPPFFRWLGAYLAGRSGWGLVSPLWVTLRGPERVLNYQALRAILNRVNAKLGTNLTLHDFRHTCALRMASDPKVALVEVQTHLRHKHISTTERYLIARPEDVVRAVQQHQQRPTVAPAMPGPWHYDAADLDALLGKGLP